MLNSGWDLKNYFGMLGSWLKQFGAMKDADMFKMMSNPWQIWTTGVNEQPTEDASPATSAKTKNAN
jgi:hypothetical protein